MGRLRFPLMLSPRCIEEKAVTLVHIPLLITFRRTPHLIMGFFDSDIVQQEAKQLFEDYQSLMQLGGSYGKFDRDGKVLYIERMEEMMDRYRVFMKRFELSDDFMARMTVEQLQTQLGQFGMTPQQMFDNMNRTLERMRQDVESNPYG